MTGALILEKHYIRRSHAAHLSVMRFVNNGPLKMIWLLVSSKMSYFVWYAEFWLIIAVALVTSLLQFSSTALLSDLRSVPTTGNGEDYAMPSLVRYNSSSFELSFATSYIQEPPVYPVFGETLGGTNGISPDKRQISDTGLIQRAMIPLRDTQNRTSLRSFQGNTLVTQYRTACTAPQLTAEYGGENVVAESVDGVGRITGLVSYSTEVLDNITSEVVSCETSSCKSIAFNCYIPGLLEGSQDIQTSLCSLGLRNDTALDLYSGPRWNPHNQAWSTNTSIFMVLSSNMRSDEWPMVDNTQLNGPQQQHGEWASFEVLPDRFVQISLCFSGFSVERNFVSMAASGIPKEPVMEASITSSLFNTSEVQAYLGIDAAQRSHSERGILTLSSIDNPQDGSLTTTAKKLTSTDVDANATVSILTSRIMESNLIYAVTIGYSENTTFATCRACWVIGESVHDQLGLLVSDIVSSSNRAADALQSFIAIAAFNFYQDYLPALEAEDMRVTRTVAVLVPGRCASGGCRGFVAVAVLVGVHLVVTAVITALYATRTRYSRHDNVWHTISQLMSAELVELLAMTNNSDDLSTSVCDDDAFVKIDMTEDGFVEVVTARAAARPL